MKKISLLVFIIAIHFNGFPQIGKEKVIVSMQGNYMKQSSESGGILNQTATTGKYLNLSTSLGYFVTDRFMLGFGLDYNWNKELRQSSSYINNVATKELVNVKSHVFLPSLYLGYYHQIINKLYFSTHLKLSYGTIKVDDNTNYASSALIPSTGVLDPTIVDNGNYIAYDQTSKFDFFSAKINPELTYFISEKIGLSLGLGGIEYSITEWKNDNATWAVNFNPTYWKFGMKIIL